MGLLTAAQKTAIATGAPVRQTWVLYVPRAAGSSTFDGVTIHDDDGDETAVVECGSRSYELYNVSLKKPGNLRAGDYDFVVDNADGVFSPEASTNHFYNSAGTYQAMPPECYIEHRIYVLIAGGWSELSFLKYNGQIADIDYEEKVRADGTIISTTAAIKCELRFIEEFLRREWVVDDCDDDDTGLDLDAHVSTPS